MKTRITRVTVTKNSISDSDNFDIEIIDEGGEYLVISCGINGSSISINPSEWPFLRDAIDRMFVEIAENESEGKEKLKVHVGTLDSWDSWDEGDEQAKPAETSEASGGWIPWNGGECPVDGETRVLVHLRGDCQHQEAEEARVWEWQHCGLRGDIIAYKVVD